ncbi:MAG: T9SS type A sorting domain-containing protein, partial [Chitinophagales bacterium]|nr:T9SS type A sorting domain-containing protein [Chitinophagales bacterium]
NFLYLHNKVFHMLRSVLFSILFIFVFVLTSVNLTGQSSIVNDYLTEDIKVFPNPTTDYFQINNGVNVKKVIIYNMFGKEIRVANNYTNTLHDVTDLKSGMYIVKMLDDRNKVVKSIKLQKSSGGA